MKWNDDDLKIAIQLNMGGKRFSEIGLILVRNARSVQTKLSKLGYSENKIEYYETVHCQNCNIEFSALKNEERKFCSQSCNAIYNNKKRFGESGKKMCCCLNCGVKLNGQLKYCNSDLRCFE